MKNFPNYKQTEAKDCGPTCIKILAKHYGKLINTQELHTLDKTTREVISLIGLSDALESVSFKSLVVKLSYTKNFNGLNWFTFLKSKTRNIVATIV